MEYVKVVVEVDWVMISLEVLLVIMNGELVMLGKIGCVWELYCW